MAAQFCAGAKRVLGEPALNGLETQQPAEPAQEVGAMLLSSEARRSAGKAQG